MARLKHSGAVERLGLGIECLALSRLATHCTEALDAKLLASSHHSLVPFADARGVPLLRSGGLSLGHDLAGLVAGQLVLGEAAAGLRLGPTEHRRLGPLA